MTIGQRIAQKRKARALSQEALGETLGVSRQSIYKWESDAALPEIDKLIALSKLFGVSVGWLLGVEEDAAPESNHDLTDPQLELVKQIVEGYIAALPSPSAKFLTLFKVTTGALAAGVAALVIVLISFSRDLDLTQERFWDHNSHSIQMESDLEDLTSRVDTLLQTQSAVTASYLVELTAVDYAQSSLSFSLKATPKFYTEGLQAVFLASSEMAVQEFPAERGADGSFSVEAVVPLADDLSISVIFISPDGARQTQPLEVYKNLYRESLSPQWVDADDALFYLDAERLSDDKSRITIQNAIVSTRKDFYAGEWLHLDSEPPLAVSMQIGLFLNQKLVGWAEPCQKPPTVENFNENNVYYQLPDCTLTMDQSDRLCVVALMTDNFGRTYFAEPSEYRLDVNYHRDGLHLVTNGYDTWDWDPSRWEF